MKVGSEDRNKLIAAGSFGVLAVGYLLYTLLGTGSSFMGAPKQLAGHSPAPGGYLSASRFAPK